jgi:hypothetical protein
VDRSATPTEPQIVVALIDGEFTVNGSQMQDVGIHANPIIGEIAI